MEHETNNKSRREFRSKQSKPFYKKISVWLGTAFIVLVGAVGVYGLGEKEQTKDETTNQIRQNSVTESDQKATKDSESKSSEQEETDKKISYDDFKGTYVTFKDEPYNSPIITDILVFEDNDFHVFDRWELDTKYTIIDKNIEGNTLTLNIDSGKYETPDHYNEDGTEQFQLDYQDDDKVIYRLNSKNDNAYYSMADKDLQEHYKQSEIDYARIIMTLRGVPSLDSWAVFSSEYDGDKPIVGVSNYKKGDPIPYIDDEKDVGYPEDVTTLYLKNKTRQDEISYTYSSIEDGYIRVYPVPLNHAIRTGEEVIDDAEEKQIKPFEPYEVADFIGNVEFDDE